MVLVIGVALEPVVWEAFGEPRGRWFKLVGEGTPCDSPCGTFLGLNGDGKGGEEPYSPTPF